MSVLAGPLPLTQHWKLRHWSALRKLRNVFLWQWLVLTIANYIVNIAYVASLYYRSVLVNFAVTWDSWFQIPILTLFILGIGWSLAAGIGLVFPDFRARLFLPPASPNNNSNSVHVDDIIKQRSQMDAKDIPILDRLTVMQEIDERVGRLRNRTSMILAAIGVALVAAAFVVLFAGRLTSIDAEAVSNVDRAKSELAEATQALTRLYRLQLYNQELDDLKKEMRDRPTNDLAKQIVEKQREYNINFGTSSRDPGAAPSDLKSATSMVETQQKEVENLRALLDDVRKKDLLSDRGYSDWRYIVATAITRVGVVLIIVFLVQILMGLYRYNTRLVAYYSSRRDLLTLWEGDHKTLKSLDAVLAPPRVDFGKEPKHPLEDIIKAVGSKLNSSAATKARTATGEV
jgi:hypothetical protein